jgi:hypothetical protein
MKFEIFVTNEMLDMDERLLLTACRYCNQIGIWMKICVYVSMYVCMYDVCMYVFMYS